MRKFEQIGIEHQAGSFNKFDALRNFKRSCYICCYKGINIECEKCGIAQAHKEIVAYFDDENKRKNERVV